MTQLIKSLSDRTTKCAHTALAVAAFLLASQPAAAATFLFTLAPVNSQTAPGATGFLEVDLTNSGSVGVPIGAFRFGLATDDPSDITFVGATPGTLTDMYIFTGVGSWHGPNLATTLNPAVAAMDQSNSGSPITLAPGATVGLGYVSYQINSAATPGGVVTIAFEPTYNQTGGACSSGLCEYVSANYTLTDQTYNSYSYSLVGGTVTVASADSSTGTPEPEPGSLLLAGGLLIALGAIRERRLQHGKGRRKAPGVRKSALPEAGEPGKDCPGAHGYAT